MLVSGGGADEAGTAGTSASSPPSASLSIGLNPKSTKAFARRVTRQGEDPSRASAVSALRSSSLRKPDRIMLETESSNRKSQEISPGSSISRGISWSNQFKSFFSECRGDQKL